MIFKHRSSKAHDYYLRSRDGRTVFKIPEGQCCIGRGGELADYFHDFSYIAERQAALQKTEDGKLFISPSGLNPTSINGKSLACASFSSPVWTRLHANDSLVLAGHQFDVISVPSGETPAFDFGPCSEPNRDPVGEIEGYNTFATGITRYVLCSEEQEVCSVTHLSAPKRAHRIQAEGIDWFFTFPGGDEPTLVPGLRGHFVDAETEKSIAPIVFKNPYSDPQEYVLDSPDGKIQIYSSFDGSFRFFLGEEKIAHFKRCYDPTRQRRAFGETFPMDYYFWLVPRFSKVTHTLILSLPFVGYFGVSANYRLEELRHP